MAHEPVPALPGSGYMGINDPPVMIGGPTLALIWATIGQFIPVPPYDTKGDVPLLLNGIHVEMVIATPTR